MSSTRDREPRLHGVIVIAGLVARMFAGVLVMHMVASPGAGRADPLATFASSAPIASPLGGFSGLVMAPDGLSALTLSDRGKLVHLRLTRTDGHLTAAAGGAPVAIRDAQGAPMPVSTLADSEGLTRLPDGGVCISFEGESPRVACHAGLRSPAQILPAPRNFTGLPKNASLEALASDATGQLYTLPEAGAARDGSRPIWRWDGTRWSEILRLPDQDGFRPVGADIWGDDLYLLLRRIGLLGFETRLLRLPVSGGAQSGGLAERLMQSGPSTHGNLEGLSLWQRPDGALMASMVSDDNQNALQRSQIVEYRLPAPLASPPQTQ